MKYAVEVAGRTFSVELEGGRVTVDGRAVQARLDEARDPYVRRLSVGDASFEYITIAGENRGTWRLLGSGERLDAVVTDQRRKAIAAALGRGARPAAAGAVRAPMPGLVVRVLVAEGDRIEAGAGLVVVEAMKMQNQLKSPAAGVVRKIHVQPGAAVEKGAVLVELAPPPL